MDEKLRQELAQIGIDISELKTNMKAAFRRIDEQKELSDAVHKLALAMERMLHEQERLRSDVDEMKQRSTRRWDTVVVEVIKLVIAVAAGAVLMRVGLA